MPTYRAFQVTGQRQFELVEREVVDPEPGHVRVRVLGCGVCHSDFLGGRGYSSRPQPAGRPRPRDHRRGRRGRPGRDDMERRRPGRPWLPRRTLRRVHTVPAGRFRELPQPAPARNQRRRRLRRDGVRPRHWPGQGSGVDGPDRSRAAFVRGNHDVQRAAPRGRTSGRRGGHPGHRRPGPHRRAAGQATRLPDRGYRPRPRTRPSWRHLWAPTTTSTARRPTPARRCRNWAERR